MATKTASVVLSVNAIQPTKVIDALSTAAKRLGEDLVRELNYLEKLEVEFGKNNAQYKAQKANIENLEKTIKSFNSATSAEIDKAKSLSEVLADLANTKLRDLKAALGSANRSLAGLTGTPEDLARAKQLREEARLIGDEIRKRTGEYVNMGETMRKISTISDETLSKAIKQQKQVVATTEQVGAAYQKELQTLKQLEAEESRRKTSAAYNTTETNARTMFGKVTRDEMSGMSQQSIEAGIRAMKEYQSTVEMGSVTWKAYEDAITRAEAHIKSFTEQQKISVAQAQSMAATGQFDGKAVSSNQIKEAQKVLGDYKGTLTDPAQVKAVEAEIAKLQERWNALNGVVEKTTKVTGDAARNVREVFRNPYAASPENVQKAIESLSTRLRQLPADSKGAEVLRQEIERLKGVINGTRLSQEEYNKVLANPRTASVEQLKKAYAMLQQQIERTSRDGSSNFNQLQQQAKRLKAEIDSTTISVQKQDGWFRNAIRNIGAYMGVFAAFNAIKNKITEVIQGNLKLSDSLTDIRKVSGLAAEDINKLSQNIAKIDTRSGVEELNKLAYAGAKLGIGKYGTEGMLSFVKASDQVNVALKEDLGDEALTILSKMTETMGLIPKLGVEKSMLAVGSAAFKLASTSTATAKNTVAFTERLTGLARTAGITTDQLLALGSASDAMMLMPEVSSTAFNKVITAIQTNPKAIEKSLEIEEGTIGKLFEAGKAMDVIVMILEQMKKKGNMSALGDVFKDLGSDSGARLRNVMVTMAKNVDMLKTHLDVSKEAFEDAEAVTAEYILQQETAQALMERANNLWEKAFINTEGVDNVKALAQDWYDFSQQLTTSESWMWSMKTALEAVIGAAKLLLSILPHLIIGLGAGGVAGAIGTAISAVRTLGGVLPALQYGLLSVQKAFTALSVVGRMTWIGAAVGVIAGLVSAFRSAKKATDEFGSSLKSVAEFHREALVAADKETSKLDQYRRLLSNANTEQRERERILRKFNEEYRPYLSKLDIEITKVGDLFENYKKLNREMRQQAIYKIKEQAISERIDPLMKTSVEKGQNLQTVLDKAGIVGYDRAAVRKLAEQGRNGEAIYRKIIENIVGEGKWDNRSGGYISALNGKSYRYDALRDAVKEYATAIRNESFARAEIEQMFAGEFDKGWQPFADDDPGVIIYPKDKDKGPKGKTNNEASMAKSQANAVKANVEAFYEEQKRKYLEWVAQMNAENEKVSEADQKAKLDEMEQKKKTALGNVRQDIATLNGSFKQTVDDIRGDVYGTITDTDKGLIEAIGKSDITALHNLFSKLGQDLSKENNRTLSENLGALLDEIFAKGSRDLREAAEIVVKRQRELQTMLMKYDYKGTVTRAFTNKLQTEQLLPPAEGVDVSTTEGANKQNAGIDRILTRVRENPYELYDIDMTTQKGVEQFQEFLAEEQKVFNFASMDLRHLILLYMELIDYVGEYTEAIKKEEDTRKKINDAHWNQSDTYKQTQKEQNLADLNVRTQAIFGATKTGADTKDILKEDNTGERPVRTSWDNTAEDLGFAFKLDNDPEILLYRLRMEEAEKYYNYKKDFYQKGLASEAEYNDALQNYLSQASEFSSRVLEDVSAQTESLMSFMSPLQDFGEAVGEAFATMRTDAASGRKAVQTALKQMLKSFATETIQIIAKNEQQRANEAMHETELLAMRQSFNAAMLLAEIQSGSSLLAIKQQQQLTEEQMEALHQQKQAALRSAGIFGWCVSELGPIAGPIAYAGIMAILMGLLSYALGLIGGGDNNVANSQPKVNTKLVSGMLTYDQGNLKQMYLGNDGKLYAAKSEEQLPTGIVTQPVATTINGQPSLVGERGPELVVGRETTAAMMQNAPQLLQALLDYDKNRRLGALPAYDRGNIGTVEADTPTLSAPQPALTEELLTQVLYYLKNPVAPNINMYGREGLHEKMKQADRFMKGK